MRRPRYYPFLAWLSLMTFCASAETFAPESITFGTADGGSINAWLYGKSSHAVVLAHGAVFNKESWGDFAVTLVKDGVRVLALDFRGYGESKAGSNQRALFEDILGAIRYLRAHGASTVSVLGASMGGAAAAKASVAASPGEIDKLILLSPASFDQPEHLKGKLLVIGSRDEAMSGAIEAMFAKAPMPKTLVLLEGSAHAQHIFKTGQADKLRSEIGYFLKD